MEKGTENYNLIDVSKFAMAILVMSIHINTGLSPVINDFISNGIARIAVPFFFISSGFFYFRKKDCLQIKVFLKTLKRIALLFVGWTIIYGIFFYFHQFNREENPILRELLFLRRHIFLNPFGHLWFLVALMIGIMMAWFFIKFKQKKLALFLGIILYIAGTLGDTYYYVAIQNRFFNQFFNLYFHYFTTFRNGVFFGFVFVNLQELFSKTTKQNLIKITLFSFILFILEFSLIKSKNWALDHNMYFSLLIFTPAFFNLLLKIPVKLSKTKTLFFREYSMGIYFLHPLVAYLYIFSSETLRFPIILIICVLTLFIIKKFKIPILYFLTK